MAGFGIGAGTVFSLDGTVIGKITKITAGGVDVESVSVDSFDATLVNGLPLSDSIPGWLKRGAYELTTQHVDSVYTTLLSKVKSTTVSYSITKPNGAVYSGTCYVNKLKPEINLKELCQNSFSFQPCSATNETFAAGS